MKKFAQKLHIVLSRPSEGDSAADVDRLAAALSEREPGSYIPFRTAKRCCSAIREGGYEVTATLIKDGDRSRCVMIEPGDTRKKLLGIAADLGSTTVTAELVDINDGRTLASSTDINAQTIFGDDILSRIFYTKDSPEKRLELQQATTNTLNRLIKRVCTAAGGSVGDIAAAVISCNTTMAHFLLGLDAFPIFSAPFAPIMSAPPLMDADEAGLDIPGALFLIPAAANYLGGDTVSGIAATGMYACDGISLLMDIGTNGEMALGGSGFLIAGAGAAGPALESGTGDTGMRAAPGAVDSVAIRGGELTYTTIDNTPPVGICGSGIVDLLAQMLDAGWMDPSGHLVDGVSPRIISADRGLAVIYATALESGTGKALAMSEEAIASFTDTKAAAQTMASCLMQEAGVTPDMLDAVYLAGSFGRYIDVESAVRIGLYPDIDRRRLICAGNTSLSGARCVLTGAVSTDDTARIAREIYRVDFAMMGDFVSLMNAGRFYPPREVKG